MDLQGGPTFEDLSIDDELTQLERVVRYSSSSIALQRLVHVKMLAETVATVGFEKTVKFVVPLLAPLAADQELVVRQHLGEQLDEIARLCRSVGKEAGYRLIIETVLPTLTKLLGDVHAEVRQAAGESLVGVAGLMKPLDLGQYVLTIVLQLAHDDEQEELRMTAAALLNDLAESLGNDLCKQFVTPEMVSLSEDPVFRVRKATALNLHKICKVVGDAGIQRLLPAYIRLTQDDVYRVRKACTEALVEMSKAIGPEVSLRELTPVFVKLANDSSKLVRTGALQHLGRLISTLRGESVSEELVRLFTNTAVESMGDPVADAELRLYCAFSFPAVVITIGPERWGELRDSFAVLLRDPSWSVRKTLSHSLHEIAKILHADDVEADLVPAMEAFLRDMEDVRLGVIRHLADFFEQMTPDRREKHLNVLVEILQTTSPFNWRLREVLAQQLPRLAPLLTLDSVFFAVVPVAFGLLNDPVAVVRERTFEVVAPLLQVAGAHSGARQASMVSRVRELAHAHTYQARQMYVYICHSMACVGSLQDRPLFEQEFVPSLAELARDRVVNVRIAMSRTLSKCPDWVMELPDIRRAIHHLVRDSNPDVRHFVSFLPPILGNELGQEDKVPWVDTSSVLSDESVLTQWSVSTQRSMLSVGDFPIGKDMHSPIRSLKVERKRSSSMESGGGESGNSTTSSEADKFLSSRRPPLPAGWGTQGTSPASSPVTAPSMPAGGRSSAGVEDKSTAEAAETPTATTTTTDPNANMASSCSDVVEATANDSVGGGLGDDDGVAGGLFASGKGDQGTATGSESSEEPGDGKGGAAVDDGAWGGEEGEGIPASTAGSGNANAGEGQETSQARARDGEDDVAGLPPPIVPVPAVDPAALSSKIEELTASDEAGMIPEVNREGMLPPTSLPTKPLAPSGVRRPGPFGLGDLGARILKGVTGGGRPFEERKPVWTGEKDEDEDAIATQEESAGEVEDARARGNLTPPPWSEAADQKAVEADGQRDSRDRSKGSADEAHVVRSAALAAPSRLPVVASPPSTLPTLVQEDDGVDMVVDGPSGEVKEGRPVLEQSVVDERPGEESRRRDGDAGAPKSPVRVEGKVDDEFSAADTKTVPAVTTIPPVGVDGGEASTGGGRVDMPPPAEGLFPVAGPPTATVPAGLAAKADLLAQSNIAAASSLPVEGEIGVLEDEEATESPAALATVVEKNLADAVPSGNPDAAPSSSSSSCANDEGNPSSVPPSETAASNSETDLPSTDLVEASSEASGSLPVETEGEGGGHENLASPCEGQGEGGSGERDDATRA